MNRTKAILATIALALAIGLSLARTGVTRQSGVAHSTAGLTYHIDSVYPSATAVIPRMYGSAQPDTIPGRYRYNSRSPCALRVAAPRVARRAKRGGPGRTRTSNQAVMSRLDKKSVEPLCNPLNRQ